MNTSEVLVIDGVRTPFLKARGRHGPFSAADLATLAGRALLLRQPLDPAPIDEVVIGCGLPAPEEANIARVAALRMGLAQTIPAWTVQRNCGSGMQAVDVGVNAIASGRAHLVLAGGVEAMSRAPLLFNAAFSQWVMAFPRAVGWRQQAAHWLGFRYGMLQPVLALLKGLTDPLTGLTMGQTAEAVAKRLGVTREEMDAYAAESHQRLHRAQQDHGFAREITPLFDPAGVMLDHDDGVRSDTTAASLARLPPVFERPHGALTAGNSATIADGACLLLLASRELVARHGLPVLGRLHAAHWVGLDPREMGLGPAHAIARLLLREGIPLERIDSWEINEAFAGQVLAVVRALADEAVSRHELGWEHAVGEIPRERLNVDGGGISLGHPVGASGARIVLHLLEVLQRRGGGRGIASLCIGGGQGGAMLAEV